MGSALPSRLSTASLANNGDPCPGPWSYSQRSSPSIAFQLTKDEKTKQKQKQKKPKKSKEYCHADHNNVYCGFIKIFRLAIPAFFRFTDVNEFMIGITIFYRWMENVATKRWLYVSSSFICTVPNILWLCSLSPVR